MALYMCFFFPSSSPPKRVISRQDPDNLTIASLRTPPPAQREERAEALCVLSLALNIVDGGR